MSKTHIQQTLEWLRSYESKGCHSFVLMKLVGTTRIAARINDLKKLGYNITSRPEKLDDTLGCRYFLNELPKPKTQFVFDNQSNKCIEMPL
jgi:hypothetical protein